MVERFKTLVDIDIRGEAEYNAALKRLNSELTKQVNRAAKEEAERQFLPRIRADAPKKSGRLRDSIKVIGTASKVVVKAGSGSGKKGENKNRYVPGTKTTAVWYADAVHWGRPRSGRGRGHHAIERNPWIHRYIKPRKEAFQRDLQRIVDRFERKATRQLNREQLTFRS